MELITHNDEVLAIIIRSNFSAPGVHFFTPPEYSQQLAFMQHSEGKVIPAHVHNEVHRTVKHTQEVLAIRKGLLRIDFFDSANLLLFSHTVGTGDVVLLAAGGHGFEVLEDIEMIEVKQGPYAGDLDKTLLIPNQSVSSQNTQGSICE